MSTPYAELAALLSALTETSSDGTDVPDETVAAIFAEELADKLEVVTPQLGAIVGQIATAASRRPEVAVILSELAGRLPAFDGRQVDPDTREFVDVLLITVKEPELLGTLAAFDRAEEQEVGKAAGSPFRYWRWTHDGTSYLLCNIGKAGNVHATLRCFDVAARFRPRLAILIGMAAGIKGRARVGDVVIAESVYNYEYARWGEEGLEQAAKPYTPTAPFEVDEIRSEQLHAPWRDGVRSEISRLRRRFGPKDMPNLVEARAAEYNVKVEPLMSGGWIIESKALPAFAQSIQGRVAATEMEGAGFGAACDHLGWKWLVVRGIADQGQPTRDKYWQRLATFAAARFVRDVLVSHSLSKLPREV